MINSYIYGGAENDFLLGKAMDFASFHTTSPADVIVVTNERYGIKEMANLSVDTVRLLRDDVYLKPYGDTKVIIFPNAEKITPQGQNALLKILEEPPEYAVFILITQNVNALLSTIISRCVVKRFDVHSLESNFSKKDELEKILHEVLKGGSDKIYRAISYVSEQKNEKEDVILEIMLFFYKKMLSFVRKNDRIEAKRFGEAVKICEQSRENVLSNANFNMVAVKLFLYIDEVVNR